MDFKDFIIGEKYNISALAIEGSFAGEKYAVFKLPTGRTFLLRAEDFEAVSPARQDVRSEHSTVGTLSPAERLDRLWNGMGDVLFPNGTKNTETAPKYDPNREFRKGDKVKAVLRYGRIPNDGVPKDVILEVIADERDGIVKVLHKMGAILEIFNVYALYLKLVTPVEELEPYYVEDGGLSVMVNSRINERVVCCSFHKNVHPHAKAAAEAECDRLNAEHRKEQSND